MITPELEEIARREMLKIVNDNACWELYVRQCKQHGSTDFLTDYRERAKSSKEHLGILANFYVLYSIRPICDHCDYNPRRRRGDRKNRPKKVYYCNYDASTHTDQIQPPPWLKVQENLCPNFYIGLKRQ